MEAAAMEVAEFRRGYLRIKKTPPAIRHLRRGLWMAPA
jgi:hypothetical protein